MLFYRIARRATYILMKLCFHLRYEGKEYVPKDRGFILCSNHRSNFDPIFVPQRVRQQVHFMAKQELFQNKFLGMILLHLGAFPVDRGKGDTTAIDHSVEVIQNGGVLGMFPEGHRSTDGVPLKPKSGAALVAYRTHADVLPVAVCYTGKLKFRARILIRYGPLIQHQELGMEKGAPSEIKSASRLIMDRIIQLLPNQRKDVDV